MVIHLRVWIQSRISDFSLFVLFSGGSSTTVSTLSIITSLLHLSLPFLFFRSCHLVFFSHYKVDLKGVGEEYDGGVVKEIGTRRVVVTLELNQVLVACVRFVKSLGMVRLYEVVLFTCCE